MTRREKTLRKKWKDAEKRVNKRITERAKELLEDRDWVAKVDNEIQLAISNGNVSSYASTAHDLSKKECAR